MKARQFTVVHDTAHGSSGDTAEDTLYRPLPFAALAALAMLAALAVAAFVALGNWQLERRSWKLELIARVGKRVHAAAVAAPGPSQWARLDPAAEAYRRVRTRGTFVHGQDTLVQASTALGSGFWVLTPLRMDDGGIVLVNRGFIPLEQRSRQTLAEGPTGDTVVVGLLRPSEPGGRWPRSNDPANARWFSRDVQAIASARGLHDVAPYFIDADPMPPPAGGEAMAWPVGGLTATSFPNHHLQYALTWYALAAMVFGAACYLGTQEYRRRVRRHSGKAQPTPRAHN